MVAWILIGPQHEDGKWATAVVEAPELSPVLGGLIAAFAVAAMGWAIVVLVRASRAGSLSGRVFRCTAVLVAFGAYVGLCARTATARVVGANIGMGLIMLTAPFALVGLLVGLAIGSRHPGSRSGRPLGRRPDGSPEPPSIV